ncbi:DUF2254 domain-containing protein [Paenalkalicoccus suaedae]|uniref:DUF2254 domain-containing protein n=1 Tax=Paenalkalicoccus suaedae TaxID=2592382 RepID=A0A859F9T4_9BACI|nr:DUF2254 domain-containing protein [Paenalkalicoccus suaedae]QKS69953.1 DUF2254 domain-containing protein [Paenalkalicoccus suaedae]
MKGFLLNMKERVWFFPALYCLVAAVLSITLFLVDYYQPGDIYASVPEVLLNEYDLAKDILGVIAGALLTMTTITFSTIMIVLSTYSSQYSPRVLKNFMTDKRTLHVLGVFMGAFFYAIISLLLLQVELVNERVFSPAFGVLLSVIAIGVFAFFIHHVATYLQVSSLIEDLTKDLIKQINKFENMIETDERLVAQKAVPEPTYQTTSMQYCSSFGYIRLVDYDAMFKLACEKDILIELHQHPGDFVSQNRPIATIYANEETDEEFKLERFFLIGKDRSSEQDLVFGTTLLVEIALRAISPSLNDPNTAINCFNHLGTAMSRLTTTYVEDYYYQEPKTNQPRIMISQLPFKDFLYKTYYQLTTYGHEDISVVLGLYDSLIAVAETSEAERLQHVFGIKEYLESFLKDRDFHSFDKQRIISKQEELLSFNK